VVANVRAEDLCCVDRHRAVDIWAVRDAILGAQLAQQEQQVLRAADGERRHDDDATALDRLHDNAYERIEMSRAAQLVVRCFVRARRARAPLDNAADAWRCAARELLRARA